MRTIPSAFALSLALLLAAPAGATLIDLGNVTRDTDSGLEWLDLTETLGLSYGDVTSGPLFAAGWRYPTDAEVYDLGLRAFDTDASAYRVENGGRSLIIRQQSEAAVGLMDLIGVTASNGEPFYGTLGIFLEGEKGKYRTMHVAYDGGGGSMFALHFYTLVPNDRIGHTLVRASVPEPGAVLFLVIGLAGLAARLGRCSNAAA